MSMRSLFLSWVFAIALAGCAPSQSVTSDAQVGCRLPSDCPRGMSCLAGACVFECREDRDCLALGRGNTCDTAAGLCVTSSSDAASTDTAAVTDVMTPPDVAALVDVTVAPDVDQPDRVTPTDLGAPLDVTAPPDVSETVVENSPLMADCLDCGSGTSPYGAMIGSYRGVVAFSNGDTYECHACAHGAALGLACGNRCSPMFTSPQTQYGLAWQCIEYVRRFYGTVYGDTALATSTGDAAQYARSLPTMGFTAMLNGVSRVAPQPDDILVWTGGAHGHIAIVRAVGASSVTVIQQNAARSPADNAFVIPMSTTGGAYTIGPSPSPLDGLTVAGWYRRPSNDWRRCGDARACPDGYNCITGRCAEGTPTPDCAGRSCGPDPVTGASCGTCPSGQSCNASGRCVADCVPMCAGRSCGSDGCGSVCGTCPSGQTCSSSGACVSTCASPRQMCGSVCTDTSTDNHHCGRCGNVCSSSQTCSGGACVCTGGRQLCGGSCVDTSADNNHCGGCGVTCVAPMRCSASRCALTCAGGETACGSTCANLDFDNYNCGRCGNVCAGGQSCSGGTCSCSGGRQFCGGSCVDTSASTSNCGGCGRVCGSGQSCVGGACSSPTITMTSPSSGSSWAQGATFTAAWSSSNTTGYVRVVVRRYGSELVPVTTTGGASGSQAVTVPSTWASGGGYDICASVNSSVGVITDCRTFTVTSTSTAPTMVMSSPSSGSSWSRGSTFTVAWSSSNSTGYVRVVVRRYGSELVPVTTTGPASGSQAVTVPSTWASGGGYDICASVNSSVGVLTDCRTFNVL